jgi:hypothetical protein
MNLTEDMDWPVASAKITDAPKGVVPIASHPRWFAGRSMKAAGRAEHEEGVHRAESQSVRMRDPYFSFELL